MSKYIVESTIQNFLWPDDSESRPAWIAGMPKRVSAAHGLEIAFRLQHHINSFNAHAANPVTVVSKMDEAWYSKKVVIEANTDAASALAANPEIRITPYTGQRIPSPFDGFR